MTAPNLEQPDDADIDASLALDGFDASDRYPEYGHSALRAAYRSGWADVVAAIRDSGYTVIALPESDGPDEDGQLWFDDSDIRVDTTGKPDDTRLYVNGEPRTPDAVYRHAVALIAAAQHAGDTQ